MEAASSEPAGKCGYCKHGVSQELGDGLGNEREEIEEQGNGNGASKVDEVKKAIERLKSNRSPAPGNATAELLKAKQETTEATVQGTGCPTWEEGIVPAQRQEGLVCPSHRKGDQRELNNCRGSTLLNTGYKIFSNVL
jgi:hypothetical protein